MKVEAIANRFLATRSLGSLLRARVEAIATSSLHSWPPAASWARAETEAADRAPRERWRRWTGWKRRGRMAPVPGGSGA